MNMEEFKEFKVGTCTEMCPKKEMLLREKEKLLHKFEMKSGTENGKTPRADATKIVKCYRRSAAGREISSSDLRPFPVLLKTIDYLYNDVFPKHKDHPLVVYDFMFDRLRSVRQDMVIQNLTPFECIRILEPIARFHIYFGYILSEESELNFDACINNTQLMECLNKLLANYDKCEKINIDEKTGANIFKNRCDIEGAYLLLNLSHFQALTRGAKISDTFLNGELIELSFAWYLKNYVRVFRLMKNLSPLLLCVISCFIPEMRKYSLETMSVGFSCRNSLYPVSHLKDLLLYENDIQVVKDCNYFNIKIIGDNVNFCKKDFNSSAKIQKLERLSWIDDLLMECDLIKLLCYGS